MSTTRFVTLEIVGGKQRDLLHILLRCKALQVRVYQGFTVVQTVGQGEENINLKEQQIICFFDDKMILQWVQL